LLVAQSFACAGETLSVIDEFLRQYEREYDYYFSIARITARRCEIALSDAGIRHLVTFRAKRIDRLQDKLIKRNESRPYTDIESIRENIVDLAGVRIALFFPGDQSSAEAIVEALFDIDRRKSFPEDRDEGDPSEDAYVQRFQGYCATHYRVRNRAQDLQDDDRRFADARVEIQIASVLMLAWQEVHHDLAYKPLSGELTVDERAILDEVNGLVIAGEIAFERLQRAVERRLNEYNEPFASHYDLASYIDQWSRRQAAQGAGQ
jgi:ppGpp synthetase/RelA/SpoT-type nucleotidyltranferase